MLSRALPAVGAGDVSLSRANKRGLDAQDTRRALHHAIEVGLDLVDVAAEEAAEDLVADAIRSLRVRDRLIAAYRVPAIAERLGIPTRDVLSERLPPRYIVERVESILRRTKLEVIPLAQLGLRAFWRTHSAWPEIEGTCARLVREGKVLAWGAFVDTIEDDTPELANEPWLSSISVPFSLCERAADPVLAAAAGISAAPRTRADDERKLYVLARRPLAGGALAGSLGPGVKLRLHDDRLSLDERTLERFAVAAAKLAAFAKQTPPAARSCDPAKEQLERNRRPDELHVQTIAELALRYVVTRGAIALPRLHRSEHVAEALIAAHSPPLPADLVTAVEQLEL